MLEDTVQRSRCEIVIEAVRHRYTPGFLGVPVLTMTSPGMDKPPAVDLQKRDSLTYFHILLRGTLNNVLSSESDRHAGQSRSAAL